MGQLLDRLDEVVNKKQEGDQVRQIQTGVDDIDAAIDHHGHRDKLDDHIDTLPDVRLI